MGYDWENCPSDIKKMIYNLKREIKKIMKGNFIGFYLHGSLALGGFNPNCSDIDVLVVTNKSMTMYTKSCLSQLFLAYSNSSVPVEISFLSKEQLSDWKHPCPFDFHYSEFWRERYEYDLLNGTSNFLSEFVNTDPDLAAHITVTNHKGICVEGEPIDDVFPSVPRSDYISSIVGDFEDCLENIVDEPIYCILNVLRVYWYLEEGFISSKLEAGKWGLNILPQNLKSPVKKAISTYTGQTDIDSFDKGEIISLKNYLTEKVRVLLNDKEYISDNTHFRTSHTFYN